MPGFHNPPAAFHNDGMRPAAIIAITPCVGTPEHLLVLGPLDIPGRLKTMLPDAINRRAYNPSTARKGRRSPRALTNNASPHAHAHGTPSYVCVIYLGVLSIGVGVSSGGGRGRYRHVSYLQPVEYSRVM